MKSPKVEFGPFIRNLTREGREKLADEILAPETVRLAILKRAADGYDSLVVRPPRPLDLRHTRAAKALVSHLLANGLGALWESYAIVTPDGTLNGMELHVTWQEGQ